ncbi:MAG: protein phosphatase 2C domain-containing protein [Verrucomicrobia bacterium]|nr:protein phosphatase 2C domain-containing protein [Verrucomicrobiota bacterium]MDA1086833.1 protein phosphatase 2C domain-containing protein [Verrucomicrobiota bacterium]
MTLSTPARSYLQQSMQGCDVLDVGHGRIAVHTSPVYPGHCNEDGAAVIPVDDQHLVLAVADGVGGCPHGEDASAVALTTLAAQLATVNGESRGVRNAVMTGFEEANQGVIDLGLGAATTLVTLEISHARIRSYHAGDSLLLVVGGRGKIKSRIYGHTPAGLAQRAGLISETRARHHEERHLVSNLIGDEEMTIDVGPPRSLAARDTVILATDGLFDNLTIIEIGRLAQRRPLESAVEALVTASRRSMSNARRSWSGPDDLTVLAYRRT